jgi:membrane fusion protein, heavy metal efflux system
VRVFLFLLFALLLSSARAHNGEDHGDAPHPPPTATSPRFEARGDLFEVVGLLKGSELVLYVDRSESNEPVMQATLEVESGSFKASTKSDANGVLRMPAGALANAGKYPLTLTVSAGDESDLLSASFEHGAVASATSAPRSTPRVFILAAAGALVLLGAALLGYFIKRRAA